jgi:hypothetical protein
MPWTVGWSACAPVSPPVSSSVACSGPFPCLVDAPGGIGACRPFAACPCRVVGLGSDAVGLAAWPCREPSRGRAVVCPCRVFGLPEYSSIHCLRHPFGCEMLRQTRNLRLVQKQMRNSSITTTTVYADVRDDEIQGRHGCVGVTRMPRNSVCLENKRALRRPVPKVDVEGRASSGQFPAPLRFGAFGMPSSPSPTPRPSLVSTTTSITLHVEATVRFPAPTGNAVPWIELKMQPTPRKS